MSVNATAAGSNATSDPGSTFERGIYDRLFKCLPGQTPFKCFLDKFLISSNIVAMLLLSYLIFVVYCYSRRKSAQDFRVIIMIIGLFNSFFIIFNEILLPFKLRIRTFYIYEILRFSILFCMCYMYCSIVTRNLLPSRKAIVRCLAVYFWLVIAY